MIQSNAVLLLLTLFAAVSPQELLGNSPFTEPKLTDAFTQLGPDEIVKKWDYKGQLVMALGSSVSPFWAPTDQLVLLNNYDGEITFSQSIVLTQACQLQLTINWSGFPDHPQTPYADAYWNDGLILKFQSSNPTLSQSKTIIVNGVADKNVLKFVGNGKNEIYGIAIGKISLKKNNNSLTIASP